MGLNDERWPSFTVIHRMPDAEVENLRSLLEVKQKMQNGLSSQCCLLL